MGKQNFSLADVGGVRIIPLDVTNSSQLAEFVAGLEAEGVAIDLLVHNAGTEELLVVGSFMNRVV